MNYVDFDCENFGVENLHYLEGFNVFYFRHDFTTSLLFSVFVP